MVILLLLKCQTNNLEIVLLIINKTLYSSIVNRVLQKDQTNSVDATCEWISNEIVINFHSNWIKYKILIDLINFKATWIFQKPINNWKLKVVVWMALVDAVNNILIYPSFPNECNFIDIWTLIII